ncbi:MAG: hypothetical protein Q7U92_16195, partial [Bradyrhizobium sp.]|nr:hypothetical protein [Bradyrhizobium sp.]
MILRMASEPRLRSYFFRLSVPVGPTHNWRNKRDGLQCSRSLAAWVEDRMSEKIYDVSAEW